MSLTGLWRPARALPSPCKSLTPGPRYRAGIQRSIVAQQQGNGAGGGDQPSASGSGVGTSTTSSSSGGRPRRERPAHLRSKDDTPLREINRDRLMGLLTDRAARTLLYYLTETNLTLHNWLFMYLRENPIPQEGHWADVSGENFLRKLLASPIEEIRFSFGGRDPMYANASPIGVDPRQIAQRIMDIRAQIAKEWIQELEQVSEENALLMRETVLSSFTLSNIVVADPELMGSHPELVDMVPDDSAGGSDD